MGAAFFLVFGGVLPVGAELRQLGMAIPPPVEPPGKHRQGHEGPG
jgi:hypothetical protein